MTRRHPVKAGLELITKGLLLSGAGFQASPDTIDIPFGYIDWKAHNPPLNRGKPGGQGLTPLFAIVQSAQLTQRVASGTADNRAGAISSPQFSQTP